MKGAIIAGRLLGCVLVLLTALGGSAVAQQGARATGELSLYIFDGGRPVSGVTVRVGDTQAVTDETGGVLLEVVPGRRDVVVSRGGDELLNLDLLTAEGENVQVLVTLKGSGVRPEVDVESATPQRPAGTEFAADARAPEGENTRPGLLVGTVMATEEDAPVRNARIFFAGISAEARTDEQGRFSVELPPGNYSLSVIHEDFATQTVDDIRVIPEREVTTRIELTPAGVELQEYVVTAPYIEGSVASAFAGQRDASGVSEVLGGDQMSRSGDSDAADALKRVTGLTVEDGKYVVVRGQPARYTQTLWNGSPLPSPDPIRRIVPLDLFPTGVLAQIRVEKSYDPAFPGSFGGGLVGLETVGVPEERAFEFSAKIGGNTVTTGKSGPTHEGGASDLFGYDDGSRALPDGLDEGARSSEVEEAAAGFSNQWAVTEESIGPDLGLGASGGTRFNLWGAEVGVLAAVDWSRSFDYSETIKRDYAVSGDGSLVVRNDQVEERVDMDVDLGGLLVGAVEWDNHALRSNTFLIRKTSKRSQLTEGTRVVSDDLYIRDYLLEWNERELWAEQLVGEHDFGWLTLDWRGMLATSSRYSPDRRSYMYQRRSDGVFVFPSQGRASRHFIESDDDITGFDADLGLPVLDGETWKLELMGGISRYDQQRTAATRRFSFETLPGADLTREPEELLNPDNLGDTLEVSDQTQTNDRYDGDATISGSYIKFEGGWRDTLRVMAGVRQETADFSVRTFKAGGSRGGQQVDGGFKSTELLPAYSVTWKFLDTMQLRGSSGRTVSRPVLNELSPARYYDPGSGEEYLGNPELEPAVIDSLDLRWEWYPSNEEAVSVGVFQKRYDNPIEQSFVGVGGSSLLRQIQNADSASVDGLELSARSGLGSMPALARLDWAWLQRSYLQLNVAFIESEMELSSQDLATNLTRPLQGQADEVYNLQLGYDGERHDATLSFNRVGKRLQIAGTEGQPDVYLQPTPQLDFTYAYRYSAALKFKLNAGNLLDPKRELLQGGEIYRSSRAGRSFSLSATWQL